MNKVRSCINRVFQSTASITFAATIALLLLTWLFNRSVFSSYNISTMLRTLSFTAFVGFGQTLCLINGDINLASGATACLSAIVCAMLITAFPAISPFIWLLVGLLFGALCGGFSAVIITLFNIPPFIVCLAASTIFEGMVYVLTGGMSIINLPKSINWLGAGRVLDFFPVPFVIMVVVAVTLTLVLRYSVFGRRLFAIGGNRVASALVGINVSLYRVLVYMMSGALCAIGGLLYMCRLGTAQPTVGLNWSLPALTAAVLGGTSMSGGKGTVFGTIIGMALTTVLSNSIVLLGISAYYEDVVTGSIVIVAVLIDSIKNLRSR